MRVDADRLFDIIEAIEKIELHLPVEKDDFYNNELLQVWTIHYIQIIGEAASRISKELRDSTPEVAWGKIIGTRNVIIHGYFDIDLDIVWQAIMNDLPALKKQMLDLISHLDNSYQM